MVASEALSPTAQMWYNRDRAAAGVAVELRRDAHPRISSNLADGTPLPRNPYPQCFENFLVAFHCVLGVLHCVLGCLGIWNPKTTCSRNSLEIT